MNLKIVSLNVMQHSPYQSLRSRIKYLSNWIIDNNIDIVLIQEGSIGIGSCFTTPIAYDSFSYLYKNLSGYTVRCFPNIEKFPFLMQFTCCVASKFKMIAKYNIKDCKSNIESRNFPVVVLDTPDGIILTCSLHLSCNEISGQFNQFKKLMDSINNLQKIHNPKLTIIGGDFNYDFVKSNGYISYIDENFLSNTLWGDCSFNYKGNPHKEGDGSRIDYIFTSKAKILDAKIIFNGKDGKFISDHCGVYTEIEI
jgi:endonuclease/exonuclease/phosphatase family metal-dependent hydrolase